MVLVRITLNELGCTATYIEKPIPRINNRNNKYLRTFILVNLFPKIIIYVNTTMYYCTTGFELKIYFLNYLNFPLNNSIFEVLSKNI